MASYTLGLDLASASDASVLIVDEHMETPDATLVRPWQGTAVTVEHHVIDGIYRWPPGTPYTTVVRDVCAVVRERGLVDEPHRAVLYYDNTGVGRPVGEMVRDAHRRGDLPRACRPIGVTITSGREDNGWNIAKGNLVSQLVRVVQERRLHVPAQPNADQLRREMGAFVQRYTARGASTYEAQTESIHDDAVIALALAVYRRDRHQFARRVLPSSLGGPGADSEPAA